MQSPLLRSWAKPMALLSLCAALAAQGPLYTPQGLANVGPVNPENGFPLWYQDHSGLILEVCTDPGTCFFEVPNPEQPVRFPQTVQQALDGDFNYPDEAFFYAVSGLMDDATTGNRAGYTIALECAFGQGAVMPGDQIVFSRVRIRVDGLVAGNTYTVRHPYHPGEVFVSDDGTINMTRDLGIVVGDFTGALKGDIGPFVVPVGFDPATALPGSYISDPAVEVAIQPGPSNLSYFEIEGPGAEAAYPSYAVSATDGRDLVRLSTFAIQGRVARVKGVEVTNAYYTRIAAGTNTDVTPTWSTAVNLWARSASGQHLFASVGAGPDVGLVELGTSGNYFVRMELGDLPHGFDVLVKNLSDAPRSEVLLPDVPDLVWIEKAEVTLGGGLRVVARSSDEQASGEMAQLTGSVLSSTGQSQLSLPLPANDDGAYDEPEGFSISATTTSPRIVLVESPHGGSATAPILVRGVGFNGYDNGGGGGTTAVVTAEAGSPQNVVAGDLVQLQGSGSENVLAENAFGVNSGYSWSWTASAPISISLSSNFVASPTFVAPLQLPTGVVEVTFTLTTFGPGGIAASDSVVVTISQPAVQPQDTLVIADARYESSKTSWRASGTATVLANQTVRIYYRATATSELVQIGTAVVDATGAWQFQGGNGSAPTNARPTAAQAGAARVVAISGFNNPGYATGVNIDAEATFRRK